MDNRESILPSVKEEAHWARVVIHDLETDRPLLRLRRHLDATRLGIPNGVAYTAVLQGCQLGLEMRALATPRAPIASVKASARDAL